MLNGSCGSGKSTIAKSILRYLAFVSEQRLAKNKAALASVGKPTVTGTETQVAGLLFASLTLLDAFGNAATVHNDDSSRFGKFVKVYFSADPGINQGCIAGAKINKWVPCDPHIRLLAWRPACSPAARPQSRSHHPRLCQRTSHSEPCCRRVCEDQQSMQAVPCGPFTGRLTAGATCSLHTLCCPWHRLAAHTGTLSRNPVW